MVTKANHITITNNTICDGYYTGISLGWTWGYAKSHSYGNYVANNHIHHLMQCVLSDGAGIYTLGIQDNTVIENNYIHDIISRAFSAAGSSLLYFDEGTSNVIARNNVCFGSHSGFHEHYGKNNLVENNIFAYTNLVSVRLSNLAKDSNLTIKENTLIECILETGRTHQIRVHLAYINHPVVNDPAYGKGKATDFGQMLHSKSIKFNHPRTGKEIFFEVEPPKEFLEKLEELRTEE